MTTALSVEEQLREERAMRLYYQLALMSTTAHYPAPLKAGYTWTRLTAAEREEYRQMADEVTAGE